MPTTLIKSRLYSIKHKREIKQEINNTESNLPPHLQSFKQTSLSGKGFVEYIKNILVVIKAGEVK